MWPVTSRGIYSSACVICIKSPWNIILCQNAVIAPWMVILEGLIEDERGESFGPRYDSHKVAINNYGVAFLCKGTSGKRGGVIHGRCRTTMHPHISAGTMPEAVHVGLFFFVRRGVLMSCMAVVVLP